ncbi:MAG TPA: (2Fe-2S)-binding protein [Casimicrobiaceae bacterium]|nr:(2Fe-2S)-binding protein [Casimicrobiaceae bacterium]
MKRRRFVSACAALGAGSAVTGLSASWAASPPRLYERTRLVDEHGEPIQCRKILPRTNYVFNYPYAATPCFLLDLGHAVAPADHLLRADGAEYAWSGGVGAQRSLVAFSAICAHKLAYPTREVSFIRFQPIRSPTSDGDVIHCCADHSVYDPAAGARVVSGPAPQPLAAILLDYDPRSDEVAALGTVGAEQFDAFFRKYDFKLAMDYGPGEARAPVGTSAVVRPLTEYCRQTIQC